MTRVFGYSVEEALALDLDAHLPPESRDAARRYLTEGADWPAPEPGEREEPRRLELLQKRKDGSLLWTEILGRPIRDARGTVTAIQGTTRDISERRRAEASRRLLNARLAASTLALRESESRMRDLFENSPVGIFQTDSRGRALHINPEMARIVGAASTREAVETLHGPGPAALRGPGPARRIPGRAPAKGEIQNFEYQARRLDGEPVWIAMNARKRAEGPNGHFLIDGFAVDISERKRAEQEALESLAKLEVALASMSDAVFISDEKGRFTHFNEAFAVFHKFRNKAECARTFAEYPDILEVFFENGDKAPVEQWAVPRALRGETAANAVYSLRRRDTGETWVGSYSFGPIRDRDGRIAGSVVVGRDITERMALEARVRENEQHYRTLADTGQALIWTSGLDGGCDYFNRPWLNFTGRTLEQELGNGWAEGVHPGDFQRCLDIYAAAFERRESFSMEYRLRHRSGEYRWILDQGTPRYDSVGNFLGYIGHCLDIHEGRQAREALQEAGERLRLTLDAVNAGTWEWDLVNDANIWSPEACRLYDLDPAEHESSYENWLHSVHPEDRERAAGEVMAAAAAGESIAVEYRVNTRDGSPRWLLSRGRPQKDARGRVGRYLGIVLDITERKRSELALAERGEQLRLFVEHAPAAIAMFDSGMRYLAVSRRWCENYRLGPEALIGRSHYEVFPEIPERWKDIHRRCLAGAVERCDEDPFLRADGSTQWIAWEVRPWQPPSGAVGGLLVFSEDITERKLAQEELRKGREQLRTLINGMTDFVCFKDGADRWLEANNVALGLFRLSADGFPGRTDAELVELSPSRRRVFLGFREAFARAWDAGVPTRTEAVLSEPGSQDRVFEVVRTPMFHGDGRRKGLILMGRDITERKWIEDAQKFLLESGTAEGGEGFFRALARYLAGKLGMDFVCIDRLAGDGLTAQTVAVFHDGAFRGQRGPTPSRTRPAARWWAATSASSPRGVRGLFPGTGSSRTWRPRATWGSRSGTPRAGPSDSSRSSAAVPWRTGTLAETLSPTGGIRAAAELERSQAEASLIQARDQAEAASRAKDASSGQHEPRDSARP
jgi:PAS domain S-box-containing protein